MRDIDVVAKKTARNGLKIAYKVVLLILNQSLSNCQMSVRGLCLLLQLWWTEYVLRLFYVHKFLELNAAHITLHYLPSKQAKESNKFSQKTLANLVNVYSLALFLVSFIKIVAENWDIKRHLLELTSVSKKL